MFCLLVFYFYEEKFPSKCIEKKAAQKTFQKKYEITKRNKQLFPDRA